MKWFCKHDWRLFVDIMAPEYKEGCSCDAFEKCAKCGKYGRYFLRRPLILRVIPRPEVVAKDYAERFGFVK